MSSPRTPEPVKPILGVITSLKKSWDAAEQVLKERFSPVEDLTPWRPFDFTHFYDEEMGTPLWRRFVSFQELMSPDFLPSSKLFTNELEQYITSLQPTHRRIINLDPGWLGIGQVVLASTKPARHRIYLSEGIYAELELWFHDGQWFFLPWTYQDYRAAETLAFFIKVRKRYLNQRRAWLKLHETS